MLLVGRSCRFALTKTAPPHRDRDGRAPPALRSGRWSTENVEEPIVIPELSLIASKRESGRTLPVKRLAVFFLLDASFLDFQLNSGLIPQTIQPYHRSLQRG